MTGRHFVVASTSAQGGETKSWSLLVRSLEACLLFVLRYQPYRPSVPCILLIAFCIFFRSCYQMSDHPSNMAPSQTNQQLPSSYSAQRSLGNNQQSPQYSNTDLVAGMGSLSVSGPQGQAATQMPSPQIGYASQQVQQQPQVNHKSYAPHHHGQPNSAHGQGQFQSPVATPQYSNPVQVPNTRTTSSYPTQLGNVNYQQQYGGQNNPKFGQTSTGNSAAPQHDSYVQTHNPGYGGPAVNAQQQSAPGPQSPAPSTVSNSMNTPATIVSSIASPPLDNIPSAYQPNQAQYVYQPYQSHMTSQPNLTVQSYQPYSATSQAPGPAHSTPLQNNVSYPAPARRYSSQNLTPSQQAPVSLQYQPSHAVQATLQQQNSHQNQPPNQPHVMQPGPQASQSSAQHLNIQYHQNLITPQPTYVGTAQSYSQNQGQAQNFQYQPQQAPTPQNQQPMQQPIQRTGEQRLQYLPQAQQVLNPPHIQQQQYQNHQPQTQPQYQAHPPQNIHPISPNIMQQQYNPQIPQSSQRQYPTRPQQQVYQPQIANAQFMPTSYKPPQAPNQLQQAGTVPSKPTPKFADDPMAATTSFLGKSYKSTTTFLGTKKGMKYAAGGAGVLLAGFLGAEMMDGLGDSGDAFTDGGSGGGGFDTGGGGYDANGGGYETGESGGVDAGSSYAQSDVQGMADANSLAMQQALEQQGQMNAQALIGNDVVVQGGQSFSMAAGNSYGLI